MERLIEMQEALQTIRDQKQLSFYNSQEADKALEKLKEMEKLAADRISNDHVVADEQRIGVAELFPTVQLGYIITSVNGNGCEDMTFEEIMNLIYEVSVCTVQTEDIDKVAASVFLPIILI